MKILVSVLLMNLFMCSVGGCDDKARPIPDYPRPDPPGELAVTKMYDWEVTRKEILSSTDMVLLYGGGHHRNPYVWAGDRIADYVTYTDTKGAVHWLFDSFLFLEIFDVERPDGEGKKFANGYTYQNKPLVSADRQDWEMLIEYWLSPDSAAGAIENRVALMAESMGEPPGKRQVVISIPEPIVWHTVEQRSSVYWGEAEGRTLNFSQPRDRIAACRWFIDRVREEFDKRDFKYVELAGFYWLAEKATDTGDILNPIADYLAKLKYSFNWIPYYTAAGWERWSELGFSEAYLQPNYFFSESIPRSRLDEACDMALSKGMDMELEFDDNAKWGRAYRLRDYMEVFRNRGIWATKRLAYYQGGESLRNLKNGSAEDKELYHEFCNFVVTRPIRSDKSTVNR